MLKRFESHYMKMDGHFHINLLKNLHCLLVKTKNKRKTGWKLPKTFINFTQSDHTVKIRGSVLVGRMGNVLMHQNFGDFIVSSLFRSKGLSISYFLIWQNTSHMPDASS